jgi:hypothetical protein
MNLQQSALLIGGDIGFVLGSLIGALIGVCVWLGGRLKDER